VRNFSLIFLLSILAPCATAQWKSLQPLDSVQKIDKGVELVSGPAKIRITVLSPTVVRLRYAPNGTFPPEETMVVLRSAFADPVNFEVNESPEAVVLKTAALQVQVAKATMAVSFLDPAGGVISQDQPGYPVSWNGRAFRVWKSMPEDEHYFGLGDKAGPIDHREQAYTMWNTDVPGWTMGTDPLYKDIPFFMAIRTGHAYGIFLDNTYRSSFDFGKESRDSYSFGADGGELDYYFLYGPQPRDVLAAYTTLTGKTPLPPKFVLAYQQSRYTYFPESMIREVAAKFRAEKIPCDVLYLDIDYEEGHQTFTVDKKNYPNFEGLVHDLAAEGFKLVLITDLHLHHLPGYPSYDEGMQHGYFVTNPDGSVYVGKVWPGDSVFPDFTRAEVRRWFGGLYADFVRMGVRGFWDDMNEPSVFRYPEKTMPLDTVHSVEGRKTDHREVHNILGMENARATYEGVLQLKPDLRPYVLTRAAFAGTQRYAATWTGDNSSNWTHYQLTTPTLLSLGLSGYPLSGVDTGGFDGNPSPELLTRWMELDTFTPLFRNHSSKGTRLREPWVDGPQHEAIRKRYIETRYRLLPYIYSGMEETSRTGIPLMRPLFLDFPGEPDFANYDKEFLFGPDLLVAPLDEMVGNHEIKLPKGGWYDFWTGKKVTESTLQVNPPLETLPVYVRAGAIIPEQPVVQNVDQVPNGPLEIKVYPGADCRGSLYDDDGNTFAYQKGVFLRMQFTCEAAGKGVKVNVSAPEGSYQPWWHAIKVTIAGVTETPRRIAVNGQSASDWKFNGESQTVSVNIPRSEGATSIDLQQ
jgi:alpha-glucosidase